MNIENNAQQNPSELDQAKEFLKHLKAQLSSTQANMTALEKAVSDIDAVIEHSVKIGNDSNTLIEAANNLVGYDGDTDVVQDVKSYSKALVKWVVGIGNLIAMQVAERELAIENIKSQIEQSKEAVKMCEAEIDRVEQFIRESKFRVKPPFKNIHMN